MRAYLSSVAGKAGCLVGLCLIAVYCWSAPAAAAGFRRGPDLAAAHTSPAAALLQDGRVLVVGSTTPGAERAVDLYDPVAHRWQAGQALAQAEAGASLTVLPTGKVLLVGQSRQLFDPFVNMWTNAGTGVARRSRHSATLLASGLVLVAGGQAQFGGESQQLELYNPADNSWIPSDRLNQPRQGHAAVRLVSGKVLIAGGRSGATALSSAEIFDAQFGFIEPSTAGMLAARNGVSLTLLPNGKVLAAGGSDGSASQASCEIYDPASGGWQWAAPMNFPRSGHAATLLPNGMLLVSGGESVAGVAVAMAEIYDPASDSWSLLGNLAVPRAGHSALLLPSGSLLLAGGSGNAAAALSAEWFDPAATASRFRGSLSSLRTGAAATWLPGGKVLLAGGGMNADMDAYADLFDVATETWSVMPLLASRTRHSQSLLGNGQLLLAGGLFFGAPTAHAELFDAATATSHATAFMLTPRSAHTATLLADGTLLLVGGITSGGAALNAVERYRPGPDSWTARAPLHTARAEHSASLLADGRVLVSGGRDTAGLALDSAEIYDPAADSWTVLAAPGQARYGATATLLRSGAVLLAGGLDSANQPLARTDLFHAQDNRWSRAADLLQARTQHTATLLPSGQVLLAGGRSAAGSATTAVEIYTAEFNQWASAANLVLARAGQSAVLLPSGQILFVHGYASNWVPLWESYDTGLVPDAARQPQLHAAGLLAGGHGTLRVSGSGFRPAASADSGSAAGAASNVPLLQVQRLDNGQTRFVLADAALPFSAEAFNGRPLALADFPAGPVQLRAWVNGIPSAALYARLASVPAVAAAPQASGGVLRATVILTPASDDGGAAIGGYRVTAVPGGAVQSCLAPCSSVEFAALPPGGYAFTASAVNAVGAAPASAPSNSVVVQARSTLALASSSNPSVYGAAVVFTATVAGLAPGGTVTFQADGNALCSAVLLADGAAQCSTAGLSGGLHAVVASYSGDSGNTAAQSATLQQQVATLAANAALTSSANPSTYGDSVVLTASITTELLGGTVGFYDGATALCSAVDLSSGTASCTVNDFSVGTHAINARYSGDGDTGAAVSFALAQQVLALPTTTSLASACSRAFTAHQPFTLQAAIGVASLGGTPAGSVDFVTDSGATVCSAVPLTAGIARCSTTDIAAPAGQGQGVVTISAHYSGDSINAGSSAGLAVTVFDAGDVVLRNGFEAAIAGCPQQ